MSPVVQILSAMADSFRMDMSGDKSYREDALDSAMEVFNENTRSRAVIKACEHARQDRRAKEKAINYLVSHVNPNTATEVITRLATPQLKMSTTIYIDSITDTPRIELTFPNVE